MGKYVYVKERKTLPHQAGWWSEKKHLEVVTTYLAVGNLTEVGRMCNVPLPTLKSWKKQQWWQELIDSIQSGENQKTDNKMSKLIDRALDILVERLEGGDYQYDQKTGKLVKVPLKARDLERITSGLFDKRSLIRKEPTAIKAEELNQAERLLQLAKEFAKLTGKKPEEEKVVSEYIEGEWDAVHDQRETRLQEGVELGAYQEEESSEGQSTT